VSSVSLDGVELWTDSPVGWTLRGGVDPHVFTIEVEESEALALMARAQIHGSKLTLAPDDRPAIVVEKLTILGCGPGTHPQTRLLKVADRRWTWRFDHVFRRYNVRARTGNKTRVGDFDAPLAVAQFAPDEEYRRWSLNAARPVTVKDAIVSVLAQLLRGEPFRDEATSYQPLVLEDFMLDGAGPGELSRCYALLGGVLDNYVDYDGTVVLYHRLDDGERGLVGAPPVLDPNRTTDGKADPGIGDQIAGEPLWIVQDRRHERPRRYRVLFDREIELRVDAKENAPAVSENKEDPPLRARNVVVVPDQELTLADGTKVVYGCYVPIEDYLAAKAGTWGIPGMPDPTTTAIRTLYLSSGLAEYSPPLLDEGGANGRAIHALMSAYRTVYQLDRAWRDRIAWWRPHLVSVADPKRGTLVDSPVYSNYAVWKAWKGAQEEAANKVPGAYALIRNYYARPEEPNVSIISLPIGFLKRASAHVRMRDQDAGVWELEYKVDRTGRHLMVIPSAMEIENMPTSDPSKRNMWLQWGELAEQHEVSVVITVGMGAPNDNGVLHAVEIDPAELAPRLGRTSVGACEGPVQELRVHSGSGIAARFAWQDRLAGAARGLFGVTVRKDSRPEDGADAGYRDDLNTVLLNGDDLLAAARAAAEGHLAALVDHVEGVHATDFTKVTPKGTARIDHRVQTGTMGGAITSVIMPSEPVPGGLPLNALLSDAARKRIMRQLP
jgi:hypothetical protein